MASVDYEKAVFRAVESISDLLPAWMNSLRLARVSGESDELSMVLTLVAKGWTDEAIGARLGLTTRTVKRRVAQLREAAGVENRVQLAVACVGLLVTDALGDVNAERD